MEEFVPPTDTPLTESERRVYEWRYVGFKTLGFAPYHAMYLASSDVELHAARKLILRGCPPETAMRILT